MDEQVKMYVSLKRLPNMYSLPVIDKGLLPPQTGSYLTNKY